ncbi:MAG: succinylglutamate desuccinylase/aspartoacylase family protein [Ktedonobacterales bacterium]|nr:succinylglutamate desuccinylase/aspartoacylase family protein [Ktedonobacterales bacterium]
MSDTNERAQIAWDEREWRIGTIIGPRPGTRAAGLIERGSYADGTPVQAAVHVLVGAAPGPVLYMQAAVHGNEVNGVEVIRRVVTSLDPAGLRGALIAVPVASGPSFVRHRRRNPFDEEDSNRVWPGKAGGMASQQIAHALYTQAIRYADTIIDLHTANSTTLPHVVYGRGDAASRALAVAFGLGVLLEEDITADLRAARFTGKLRNVAGARGIPSITPELGGSDRLEEAHIHLGERGVSNVLHHLGMVAGAVEPPATLPLTLRGSHLDKVRAHHGGIWIEEAHAGERVRAGQSLGYVYAIRDFECVERHTAPYDGFILGTTDMPVVNIGDPLATICRLEEA